MPTRHHIPTVPRIKPEGWRQLRPLIKRRVALDITQGELGVAMGTHGSNVSKAERGQVRITPEWLTRYADALDRIEDATNELRAELREVGTP